MEFWWARWVQLNLVASSSVPGAYRVGYATPHSLRAFITRAACHCTTAAVKATDVMTQLHSTQRGGRGSAAGRRQGGGGGGAYGRVSGVVRTSPRQTRDPTDSPIVRREGHSRHTQAHPGWCQSAAPLHLQAEAGQAGCAHRDSR